MGKIVVKLAGKELFAWAGGKAKMLDLEKRLADAAASVRKTIPELNSLLLQSTFTYGLLADPASRKLQIAGLIYPLLHIPTEKTERPGTHRDYVLAGWDFVFDLHVEEAGRGRIEITSRGDW
jgi:hypothetical protein